MEHKLVEFQGGGLYDKKGQLMRAQVQEDGSILFADYSRGIYGKIAPPENKGLREMRLKQDYEGLVKRTVMHDYLYNRYETPAEGWEFSNNNSPSKKEVV